MAIGCTITLWTYENFTVGPANFLRQDKTLSGAAAVTAIDAAVAAKLILCPVYRDPLEATVYDYEMFTITFFYDPAASFVIVTLNQEAIAAYPGVPPRFIVSSDDAWAVFAEMAGNDDLGNPFGSAPGRGGADFPVGYELPAVLPDFFHKSTDAYIYGPNNCANSAWDLRTVDDTVGAPGARTSAALVGGSYASWAQFRAGIIADGGIPVSDLAEAPPHWAKIKAIMLTDGGGWHLMRYEPITGTWGQNSGPSFAWSNFDAFGRPFFEVDETTYLGFDFGGISPTYFEDFWLPPGSPLYASVPLV